MMFGAVNTESTRTTSWKVVAPFYMYAAIAFLSATSMLLMSAGEAGGHYFHPHLLAIVHIMALGWGTMMILGASHQLVPVLIEGALYSQRIAFLSFVLAGLGIPLLAYGFYEFDMGAPAQAGGWLVLAAVCMYFVNLLASLRGSKWRSVHAVFGITGVLWLLLTVALGLALVYNFRRPFLPAGSMEYLSLHAHIGIAGWFLLSIVGFGSRLIPMFLISKYSNDRRLWVIYGLLNLGLLAFVLLFLFTKQRAAFAFPLLMVVAGVALFANFCYRSFKLRIRKKVDRQMRLSFLSLLIMMIPLLLLALTIVLVSLGGGEDPSVITAYGFVVFFGWITSIILGMTFKTLPFIIWNKVYHRLAGKAKTPGPKDLFSEGIFRWMMIAYLAGFTGFATGILVKEPVLLKSAAGLLVITSLLYNWNVIKILTHKPVPA